MNHSLEKYLITVALSFFLILWFFNPSNSFTLLLSVVLVGVFYLKLKNISYSALLVYFLTSILPMGKKYVITLHTLANLNLPKTAYPLGLTTEVAITIADVVFCIFIADFIMRLARTGFRTLKKNKLELIDFLVLIFVIVGILSDLFFSKRPFLSLLLKKGFLESLFIYYFFRLSFKKSLEILLFVAPALLTIIFFESFLAIQQFIISSPLGKNFEVGHLIEQFGGPADEISFTFRPLGTFGHANELGITIAILLPLIFYLILHHKDNLFFKVFSFLLGFATLILSLSRSAWVAFFIQTSYLSYTLEHRFKYNLTKFFKSKRFLGLFLIFSPLLLYLLPRIAKSIYSLEESGGLTLRIRQMQASFELFLSQPFGVGTGMSVVEMLDRTNIGVFAEFPSPIHNYFILILIENGLPSLVLFLTILFLMARKLIKLDLVFSQIILASLMAILLGGLFQPFLNQLFFFLLLSLSFAKINDDVRTF